MDIFSNIDKSLSRLSKIMIYTFSPNWYKPQCLHFKSTSVYYCSNYILYEYSLTQKAVIRELCFRHIAVENHLNHKDIKINAIASNQHTLLIGINQPYLAHVDLESLALQKLVPLQQFQSVEYIYPYREGPEEAALLCDKDGYFAKYKLQSQNPPEKVELKHKLSGVKAVYFVEDLHFLVFTRGTILLYNQDFTKLQKNIEVSHQDTIYSVDMLQEGKHIYFAFLTKNKQGKEAHTVTVFRFQPKAEFPLQLKKKVEEIGQNVQRFDVNLFYPKKFSEKLKQNQKASLTIKLLNSYSLILTGKLGEIMTIFLDRVKGGTSLTLRPFSLNEGEEAQYTVWADSRHYKQIYFIYRHEERLYIVSTDHNLTIWQIYPQQPQPKYIYSVKFLTAPVVAFFHSEIDPRNVFALLKDSNIRSFTPLEEGSHQLNEYWKFAKKYKVKKAVCHPSEDGIMGLATDCNRIQLYDIYEDRLMKLIEVGQDIISISFEQAQIEKQIEMLFKGQFKEQKLLYVSHFLKEMQNKTILMVQTTKTVFLVFNLAEKDPLFKKITRQRRLQRIHQNHYWDGRFLLASQIKNLNLELFIRFESKTIASQIQLNYSQGRVLFKSQKNTNRISVVNFKGNKFSVIRAEIKETVEIVSATQIVVNQQIDYLFLSQQDWRIAVYSQRDDAILILHMDLLVDPKYEINKHTPEAQLYSFKYKIDTLCFYLQDYLIVGTKDQSIMVVPYQQLNLLKPKKKISQPQEIEQKGKGTVDKIQQ